MKLFLLFLCISIATHVTRTIYEIMKVRNKINPENKILFAVIFSNMVFLWISWFGLCISDPVKAELYPVIRYFGAAVIVAGMILFVLTLIKIRRFENYHGELVTTGVFRFVRHPMYLGFVMWMAGSALMYESVTGMILAVIYTANIFWWKSLEEIQLMKVYPEYGSYIKRTLF